MGIKFILIVDVFEDRWWLKKKMKIKLCCVYVYIIVIDKGWDNKCI